ncbi:unnamed protein product [Durusdinium trenchii]|uniref:Uncharacterized protein n=1 Tax=Durusdinium trenchii TaxID=1381693 RepID=A0ABP0S7E6_9DINO
MKSAGMLPDKFCRSGRPRKMKPEKLRVVLEERNPVLSDDEGSSDSGGPDTDLQIPAESIESDEELRMHLLGANSFFTQAVESNFCQSVQSLPTRWLPPGNIRMLFHQWGREGVSCFNCNA